MTSFTFSVPPPEEPYFKTVARWLARVFLIAGALAIGYSAYFYVSAYAFQKVETIHLDRTLAGMTPNAPAIGHLMPEGAVIGRLEIGRIGLSAIVVEGDSSSQLRHAVGHVPKTAMPGDIGNMALTAHRDTFFRPLRNVRDGDVITLDTTGGQHQYEVESTAIVPPTAIDVLQSSGQQELTLITCYPFYFVGPAPRRFVVRAHKIHE